MILQPALVLFAALLGAPALAQQGALSATPKGSSSAVGSAESASRWARLPPGQKQALQPLATEWDRLDEAHRRKWMALARNFDGMSPLEQSTLHSRMAEWALLSPRERVRARLNFAEVQRLTPEGERKAKWEAYQALSQDERKALAERAVAPRGTALPVRPVQRDRLAPLPPAALQNGHGGPRIALTPAAPLMRATLAPTGPSIAPAAALVAPAAAPASSHGIITSPHLDEPPPEEFGAADLPPSPSSTGDASSTEHPTAP